MTTVTQLGDKLQGDRVRIVARSIAQPQLSQEERSGRHKRMFTIARDTVECFVEIPARWAAHQKSDEKK